MLLCDSLRGDPSADPNRSHLRRRDCRRTTARRSCSSSPPIVFAADRPLGLALHDGAAQRQVLRETFGSIGWELGEILAALEFADDDLYFDTVAQGDYRTAFATYERRFKPFVDAKQHAAERFGSWFAPRTTLALALRNLAMRALHIPWRGNWAIARSLGDRFQLSA